MSQVKPIESLLLRARRRWLWNLAIEQSVLATAVALAGVILLLVVGTQVLDWYWLAILFLGTFGFGIYRIFSRLPSKYVVAQIVDRRLRSNDAISTAWYYAQPECNHLSTAEIRMLQRAVAEQIAQTVDVQKLLPFAMPRSVYAVTLLVVAAASMLGVRYGIRRSLDLRPPIAQVLFDFFRPFSRARWVFIS